MPKIEPNVKFLFKKFGAAVGVEQVFRRIAPSSDLQTHGSMLERRANLHDALSMGMIQGFGNSQDRRKTASDSLVAVVQRGICDVVPRGLRFSIVITHQRGNDGAVAAFESWDIAVEHKIFAVLVVAAMGDAMADVVEERAGFEFDAGLRGEMVQRL